MFDELKESIHPGKPEHACNRVNYQYADVSVPVKVKPFAKVGKIDVECCGEPVIYYKKGGCFENGSCEDRPYDKEELVDFDKKPGKHDICEILIKQTIYVKIPIQYGAFVDVGDEYVQCGKADSELDCKCK